VRKFYHAVGFRTGQGVVSSARRDSRSVSRYDPISCKERCCLPHSDINREKRIIGHVSIMGRMLHGLILANALDFLNCQVGCDLLPKDDHSMRRYRGGCFDCSEIPNQRSQSTIPSDESEIPVSHSKAARGNQNLAIFSFLIGYEF